MEIQGRIKQIFAPETVGQNGFQKRDLVITTEEQYPNDILIQFTQQRCDLLNNLKVGQNVRVHFNLRGREWTNQQGEVKYFNTIEGWKIELIQTTNVAQQQQPMPQYQQHPQGYPQQSQYAPPQQAQAYPPQGQPQYQQGQMFNQYGQAPAQDGVPY
jgi:hypothetical protein